MKKRKTGCLVIECEQCGTVFTFTCKHRLKENVEANLDWAIKRVTLCYDCRPNYALIRYIKQNPHRFRGIQSDDR